MEGCTMTQILNVTTTDDGKHQVTDGSGHLVDGPFDTNGEAWAALDRLTDNDASRPDKRRSNKKVLWGQPEHNRKSAKQHKKERLAAKKANQIKANAAKATGWIKKAALGKFDPNAKRVYRDQKLGTFGAASEVKRIDPAQYLAEKAARGEC
jgi:tetrahydrodipicolinate N-succinyltransferase